MTGILNIISVPDGAKIFLDGTDTLLITPNTFTLNSGIHKYKLSLNSYLDISGTVDVIEAQQTNLVITLPDDFYNKLITISIAALGLSALSIFFKGK